MDRALAKRIAWLIASGFLAQSGHGASALRGKRTSQACAAEARHVRGRTRAGGTCIARPRTGRPWKASTPVGARRGAVRGLESATPPADRARARLSGLGRTGAVPTLRCRVCAGAAIYISVGPAGYSCAARTSIVL